MNRFVICILMMGLMVGTGASASFAEDPYFSQRSYRLAASRNIPAGDLSGATFNTRSNTPFLLNEASALFEIKRNGEALDILRTIHLINPGYDLEAVSYVRTEPDGGDLFVFLSESNSMLPVEEKRTQMVFIPIGHDDLEVDLNQAKVYDIKIPAEDNTFVGPGVEALAYDADRDMGTYYMGSENNLWHITLNEFDASAVRVSHNAGKAKDLFQNERIGPNLFNMYYPGVQELTTEGELVSIFYFPSNVIGKIEGMSIDPNTKDIYLVKESSPGQINFWCFEATPPDITAPSRVSDIAATADSHDTITLNWSAPYDDTGDSLSGEANKYDVRYSKNPITEASFASAIYLNHKPYSSYPRPGDPGATDTATRTSLEPETTYYFALKTIDEVGNTSEMSNVASATTAPPHPLILGDVDGNGFITSADTLLAAKLAVGLETGLSAEAKARADVDGIPGVTVNDVTWIARKAAGL